MLLVAISISSPSYSAESTLYDLKIIHPDKGFVSTDAAEKWDQALICGNGSTGALIYGQPVNETITFSHEDLFLPQAYPKKQIPLAQHIDKIQEWVMNNEGEKAGELIMEIGKKEGYKELIWPDPLSPAAQLLIAMDDGKKVQKSIRSVDFETAEALVAWKTEEGVYHRNTFVSRSDDITVVSMTSPDMAKINCRFRLANVPYEENKEWGEELGLNKLEVYLYKQIEKTTVDANVKWLAFTTKYRQNWQGALGGMAIVSKVITDGVTSKDDEWLKVSDASEVLVITKMKVCQDFDIKVIDELKEQIDNYKPNYDTLFKSHAHVHSEIFNRVSLDLNTKSTKISSEKLIANSSFENTTPELVERLFDAARYAIICSTGKNAPTLQGIWTGTWQPAWSSDYTLNGNIQTAIAFGLSGNFPETTLAYLDTMERFMDDLHNNAKILYGSDGIMVPSRGSVHCIANHFTDEYPMILWTAGAGWTSQYYYDVYQYTQDKKFLEERAIPFMTKTAKFYEDFLTVEKDGKIVYVPSYSPEIGPLDHPTTITANATMDIAIAKQLFRNLITLSKETPIDPELIKMCKTMLKKLPDYEIGEDGALREWIWPGLKNNDTHRHASHLYPLYYENDPEIMASEALKKASLQAIENRLDYRRPKNGAEMAFGIVQLGQPAAHLGATDVAYECLRWLANSYWRSNMMSTHDPDKIFNVDICGGVPALIIDMLLYSEVDKMTILPALPSDWAEGSIKGIKARGGFTLDIAWKDGKLSSLKVHSLAGRSCQIFYGNYFHNLVLKAGSTLELDGQLNKKVN